MPRAPLWGHRMHSLWMGAQGIIAPQGLILGLLPGTGIPAGWAEWTAANGRSLLGTSAAQGCGSVLENSSIALTTGTGGSHTDGTGQLIQNYGVVWGSTHNQSSQPWTKSPYAKGAHAHAVTVTYTPAKCEIVLVRAQNNAPLFDGLVGFSTQDIPLHDQLSTYDGFNGHLFAGTQWAASEHSVAATVGSAAAVHYHIENVAYGVTSITGPTYTATGTSLGAHTHSISLAATVNTHRIAFRMFKLLANRGVRGLIGAWLGSTIPPNWELVAEANNKHVWFSGSATGEISGNGTLALSNTSSYVGHAHGFSGTKDYTGCSAVPHSNSVTHAHAVSASVAYHPSLYIVQFIRYKG